MGMTPKLNQNKAFLLKTCLHCGGAYGPELYCRSKSLFFPDHYSPICNQCIENILLEKEFNWAVVDKFCQYLDSLFDVSYANEFLDLVAVGLVGDMMDQRELETARLIRKGLPALKNPFLVTMREKNSFSIGETLTPIGAAFYIVPFINAMNRSGTLEEQWLLFESMLDWKGYAEIPS